MPATLPIRARNNVAEYGSGEHTLIFAHGFGTDRRVWQHQLDAFQSEYRLLTFDHVGCGASDLAAYDRQRYSSFFGYAQDLIELCRECQVQRATMVAHSASGMIALLASILAPELFDRLILLGASPRYLNDDGYVGGMSAGEVEGILHLASSNFGEWISGFAPGMVGVDRPDLVQYLSGALNHMRPDIALLFLRVMLLSDFRAELPRVQRPTWILQTQSDRAVPREAAQYLHRAIHGSCYVELPTDGHLPHISNPALVNESLRSILES